METTDPEVVVQQVGASPACLLLLSLVLGSSSGQWTEENNPWYSTGELPEVDLEGVLANISAQISWFKYIGEVILDCSTQAHEEETLVLSVQRLYTCLHANQQQCASEYGVQGPACADHVVSYRPCGNLRLGYGSGRQYENAASCRWYLQVPDGFVMNLTFEQFYVEYSGTDCVYDHVQIYDGHSTSNHSYGKICGRIDGFTLYGSSDVMMVTAHTDASIAKYGFRAFYQVMDPGLGLTNAGPAYHTGTAGSLYLSPESWIQYEQDENNLYLYKWYVTTDFSLNFRFNMSYRADVNGSVTLFDGPTEDNVNLGELTYLVRPQRVQPYTPTSQFTSDATPDDVTTTDTYGTSMTYPNSSAPRMSFTNETLMTSTTNDMTLVFTPTTFTAPRKLRDVTTDMTSSEGSTEEVTLQGEEDGGYLQQPVQEMVVETTLSNQMLFILRRSNLSDNTEFNVTFTSQQKGQLNLLQDPQCIGQTRQEVMLDGLDIEIGLQKDAKIQDGVPIQCFWNISAPVGTFVQLEVTSLHFNSPSSENCMYEGLLVVDGPSLGPDEPRYGPFCYDGPRGFFTFLHRGVNNVTTSGPHLFIMYYSFVNYERNPWPRGPFRALVRASPCQGVFQPCSLVPAINTPRLRLVKQTTNGTLEVRAFCDKASCCVLQQLPVYGQHDWHQCHLSILVEGQHLIATSKFQVGLAVPNKADTTIMYSCERKDWLTKQQLGGSRALCLATASYITYVTSSSWAQGAFVAVVSPARCGYFRPDVHYVNVFFPPCVRAEMMSRPGRQELHVTDPLHKPETYYEFHVDFAQPSCRHVNICNTVRLELRSRYMADVWSEVRIWPWRWFSWGSLTRISNWTQTLTVFRDLPDTDDNATCEHLYGDDCRLVVKIQNTSLERRLPPRNINHRCPPRFDAVGKSCYAWAWPGRLRKAPRELLPLHLQMSSEEAAAKCRSLTYGRTESAHLVDIDTAEEAGYLSDHIFLSWFRRALSHVPGAKVIHIGIHDKLKAGRYMTSQYGSVIFSQWHIPGVLVRGPDDFLHPEKAANKSGNLKRPGVRNDGEAGTPGGQQAVRSDLLRKALNILQPENNPAHRCVVSLITGNKMAESWLKVPCNLRIPGAVALCEVAPQFSETPSGPYGNAKVNISYTSYIQSTKKGKALRLSSVGCPPSMNLQGELCYAMFAPATRSGGNETVLKETARSRCPELFGVGARIGARRAEAAFVDEELLKKLHPVLRAWKVTDPQQGIRVVSRDPLTGDLDPCYAILPDPRSRDSAISPTWSLMRLDTNGSSCRDERVTAFLCQANPVPVGETCNPNIHHRCADGTCILATYECDGVPDCPDASDELHCPVACRPANRRWHVHCPTDCHPHNCTCAEMYFQCKNGGCIPISKICDHQIDCSDGSDERICNIAPCKAGQLKCAATFQCYKEVQRCDSIRDCDDGTDEKDCDVLKLCSPEHPEFMLCGDNRTCLSASLRNDSILDCPLVVNGTDESELLHLTRDIAPNSAGLVDLSTFYGLHCLGSDTSCSDMLAKCYDRMRHSCIYELNAASQMVVPCRLGQHLQDCQQFQCPLMFKCPNSYCVPLEYVCDGRRDCLDGEDEAHCQAFYCPGMFKCKGSIRCLRQEKVCDRHIDCPLHRDDEQLCGLQRVACPHRGCTCRGYSTRCTGLGFVNIKEERKMPSTGTRAFIYRDNDIWSLPSSIKHYIHAYRVDFSENFISAISLDTFTTMTCLEELYLHNNRIESLTNTYRRGLPNLRVITLYGNYIRYIGKGAFSSFTAIRNLDLSQQYIQKLDRNYFENMTNLRMLNLSHNQLQLLMPSALANRNRKKDQFMPLPRLQWISVENNPLEESPRDLFKYVPATATLRTDKFKFCCFTLHVKNCFPDPDEFSSCYDLLENPVLRAFVWITGLLAITGNTLVYFQRAKHEKETVVSILVQHMAFSDLLIGCYMLIIASADLEYRGQFILKAEEWQSSKLCKTAGFLHMVGVEMSMLSVTLITADRAYALLPYCGSRGLGMRATRTFLALGWTATIILGAAPLLDSSLFGGRSIIRNGACMLLNVLHDGQVAGWEYSMSAFSLLNSISTFAMYFVFGLAYLSLQHSPEVWTWYFPDTMTDEEKENELTFRRNEAVIARRTMVLIFTNFIVWLPVAFMGALALFDIRVDRVTAAWVGLFLVPINSVLNPYMYTFSAGPRRGKTDDLLLNWVPDMDDAECELVEQDPDRDTSDSESGLGETSEAATTTVKTDIVSESNTGDSGDVTDAPLC